jgi:hypothetical protein
LKRSQLQKVALIAFIFLLGLPIFQNCGNRLQTNSGSVFNNNSNYLQYDPQSYSASSNFDTRSNMFVKQNKKVPAVYDLVPMLSDPNIGIHSGGIANYMPQIDRIYNIDEEHPSIQNSTWYLAQWKKSSPIMLNGARKDVINKNSTYRDGYLGKPIFEILSPTDALSGIESSLRVFLDTNIYTNVFEITGKNGWYNRHGGSNVFLSTDIVDREHNQLDSPVELTYNGKITKLSAEYYDQSSDTRNMYVVGQAFVAFYAQHTPTDGSPGTGMFIQIYLGDTRGHAGEYTGCYEHNGGPEIVYGGNLDGTFQPSADSASAPLKPYKYNLNKYLCRALEKNYACPANFPQPNFAALAKDLKNWQITGFYTGMETQAGGIGPQSDTPPSSLRGQTEVSLQYSNLRISANHNFSYTDCDSVLANNATQNLSPLTTMSSSASTCQKGTFTGGGGQIIEFSCGCGEVPGAARQSDGCYHKALDVLNILKNIPTANSSVLSVTQSTVSVAAAICGTGTFQDSAANTIYYSCNCGPLAGGTVQPNGCYHQALVKKSPVTSPPPVDQCKQGEFLNDSGATVQWYCGCGSMINATDVGSGCYHRIKN